MTDLSRAEMPRAWEDVEGWERYYSSLSEQEKRAMAHETGVFGADRVRKYAEEMRGLGWNDVWVAGCGCSCLGWMFAMCGIGVRVTDVSATAVKFQRSAAIQEAAARLMLMGEARFSGAEMKEMMKKGGPRAMKERAAALRGSADDGKMRELIEEAEGKLVAEVQDFREPYSKNAFALIFNFKAIQGFTVENQRAIARTHFAALKAKGTAFFAVQNVQGQRAEDLETALADAGFLVPGLEAKRWRRRALDGTGIPYAVVMGRPVAQVGDGESRARDNATLQRFEEEYKERVKEEHERAKKRAEEDAEVRYVQMIWGTG